MNNFKAIILCAVASLTASSATALDLSPELCVEMALANNETLMEARNSTTRARLDRTNANMAILPRLDGSATALYHAPDMDMGSSTMVMHGAYVAGLQLVQPIYTGGKILAGRQLGAIGQQVADQQLRKTRADVIYDATNAYWTYVAVHSKVTMMQHYMAMMDSLMGSTSTAVEAGLATANDLLRVNAQRSELLYQQQKVTSGERLCRMSLCTLMGIDPDTPITLPDTLPECQFPQDFVTSIADRPELHLLDLQVKAREQQVKLTRGDYLPTVGLSLGYNYYGNIKMKGSVDMGGTLIPYTKEMRDGMFMGILSVKVPLFNWGEGCRKVKQARLDVENARLQLQRNTRLMNLEAEQAATNLRDGMMLVTSARTALDQATESLRVMQSRYDAGYSPLTDLLQAQSQWHQALSSHIEATTQFHIYHTAWQRATGRL